jgi:hypothetical protein
VPAQSVKGVVTVRNPTALALAAFGLFVIIMAIAVVAWIAATI